MSNTANTESPTHLEMIVNRIPQGVVSGRHLPAARAMARDYTRKGATVRLCPRTVAEFLACPVAAQVRADTKASDARTDARTAADVARFEAERYARAEA